MEEFAHSYILVAYDNSTSLSAVFSTVTSLDDFLGRDELMPIHPVSIDDPATEVNIEFDFDGFMIEVSSLAGVKAGIHRLRLPEFCHPGPEEPLSNTWVPWTGGQESICFTWRIWWTRSHDHLHSVWSRLLFLTRLRGCQRCWWLGSSSGSEGFTISFTKHHWCFHSLPVGTSWMTGIQWRSCSLSWGTWCRS